MDPVLKVLLCVGLGTSLENCFVLYNPAVLDIKTNTKLLVVAFLYDDNNKVSHPLIRSLVRSESRFLMTFIIGVKSYMRVTNVTIDIFPIKKNDEGIINIHKCPQISPRYSWMRC